MVQISPYLLSSARSYLLTDVEARRSALKASGQKVHERLVGTYFTLCATWEEERTGKGPTPDENAPRVLGSLRWRYWSMMT